MTKAQQCLATSIFASTRCGGEKVGERRIISCARDSSSAAAGATGPHRRLQRQRQCYQR